MAKLFRNHSTSFYLSRMPIRPELRPLYPPHWRDLSARVRFERAGGKCQGCGRPHLQRLRCLPDGRFKTTRVVLAAAHLDSNPANNRWRNLRALCQRCHMLRDRPHHLRQRWITYRRRWALGDLFLGPYGRADPPYRS